MMERSQRFENIREMGSRFLPFSAPSGQTSLPKPLVGECDKHGPWMKELRGEDGIVRVIPSCGKCIRESRSGALLGRAGIPLRFREKTFENFELTSHIPQINAFRMAKDYAATFNEASMVGKCLVFTGNTGTGKTHLACAIANELLRQGKSALFVRAYEVLRTIRDTWKSGEKTELAVIREFVAPDLLILDEVGVQYGSESERIELFKVVNGRYDEVKPMIMLSNLATPRLLEYLGERIYDRLLDAGGRVVTFDWKSWRSINSEKILGMEG